MSSRAPESLDPHQLDRASLLVLLRSAMCCPSATHVLLSLCVLWEESLRRDADGGRPATPQDVPGLLVWAHQRAPWLGMLEDFVPPALELDIRVRFGTGCYRLHPSTRTRVVSDVHRYTLIAGAVDGALSGRFGFSLSDYIELVLRHVDRILNRVAATWTSARPEGVSADPLISVAELALAADAPSLQSTVDLCNDPCSAARALAWGTHQLNTVALNYPESEGYYGGLLRLEDGRGVVHDCGVALLMESLCEGAVELVQIARGVDPLVEEKFRDLVRSRIAELLSRVEAGLLFDLRLPNGDLLDALAMFGSRHYMAISIAAGLDVESLEQGFRVSADAVLAVKPGTTLIGEDLRPTIPVDGEVLHSVVVCGPDAMHVRGPSVVGVTLDDLECMLTGSHEEQSDLYFFLRDVRDMQAGSSLATTELLDLWRAWLQGDKSLRNLHGFNMLSFSSYADLDWAAAAARTGLEVALAALTLPAARFHWPVILTSATSSKLQSADGRIVRYVLHGGATCAIAFDLGDCCTEDFEHLDGLAGGLLWALERLDAELMAVQHDAQRARALRITLRHNESVGADRAVALGEVADGRIELLWTRALWELARENPEIARAELGTAISSGLAQLHPDGPVGLRAFRDAWSGEPPFFMGWTFNYAQAGVPRGRVISPHPSLKGEAMARAVQALREAGVEAGDYQGRAAARLDTQHIYPALLAVFRRKIQGLCPENLLACAMHELEKQAFYRWQQESGRRANLAFPVLAYDPVQKSVEEEQAEASRSRALRLVIEEVLAEPPDGEKRPDVIEWREILGLGELLLDSSLRAETLAFGLAADVLRVDDHFGLHVTPGESEAVQLGEYRRALTAEALPRSGQETAEASDDPEPLPWKREEFASVRAAFLDQFGCGLVTVVDALAALRAWPVDYGKPARPAEHEEVVTFCVAAGVGPREEVGRAIDLLTLRCDDLRAAAREHWEQERRRVRLVTRPVVEIPGGRLLVAPWHIGSSLMVYARYLFDGRLPWPPESMSELLRLEFDALRQRRNHRLEEQVEQLLKRANLRTKCRIKKAKVIGLGAGDLPCGEIDVLAVDEVARVVWVVEVKDPGEHFSPMQLHRSVQQFHGSGKYVAKLLKKAEVVKQGLSSVLKSLECDPSGEWGVEPLMVTRRPEVAAYAKDSRVRFATYATVVDTVRGVPEGGAS